MLVERKACCHVANAFFSRLELIWTHIHPESVQNVQKCVFGKKLQK